MQTLYNYIKNTFRKTIFDGHIHLFDWKTKNIFTEYKPLKGFKKFIGFLGVDFYNIDKYTHENCIKFYNDFINENTNDVILLASGLDSKTVIQNYENHKDIIKGFGELLCYDKYDDINLPYKDITWVEEILEYNTQKLPVFIHYSLVSDECMNIIDDIITKYHNTPIVLCHCGLPNIHEGNYKKQWHEIFKRFLKLQVKHNNLYTDVCDSAFLFLRKNYYEFYKLDLSRVMIGTDLTPLHFRANKDDINKRVNKSLKKFKLWCNNINNNDVIKRLFRL